MKYGILTREEEGIKMRLTNRLGYPEAYVEAAKKHIYPKKVDRIGVTTLIDSPMIRRLSITLFDEIVIDVDDTFTGMLGTAFHKHLEAHSLDAAKTEKKWELLIDGITLVGVADVVDEHEIADYKLLSGWSFVFDKSETWTKQLNVLRYLAMKVDKMEISSLVVHAFVKDWTFYQAQQKSDYPQNRYMKINIPIWDTAKTESYIMERLRLHLDPNYVCNDEDKWLRHETFQVLRKGGKRAIKGSASNPITFADAEKYILEKNLTSDYKSGIIYIEEKKSEAKRCEQYCSCKSVCPLMKGVK